MLVKIYIENTQKSPKVRCGSYGFILTCQTKRKLEKREKYDWGEGTRNQLDLQVCIEALSRMVRPAEIEIFGDLQWIACQSRYIDTWKANDWKTSSGKPVKNMLLWQQFADVIEDHEIKFVQCKKHEYSEEILSVIGKGGTGIYGC